MDIEEHISNLQNSLKSSFNIINGPFYSISQRQLGEICYGTGHFLDAIYHFSESHAVGLRQMGVLENARSKSGINESCNPLSFYSTYARNGVNGMLERLKEMPSEWTFIQLTRKLDPSEALSIRKINTSPKLKGLFLSKFPCGEELKKSVPVIVKLSLPDNVNSDLIEEFLKIKEKIGTKTGNAAQIRKLRQGASLDVERYCRDIGPMYLKEWTCLMLGRLYSKALEEEIRNIVDKRLDNNIVSTRERYLCYLLAEGCCHLENADLEVALYQVFEDNEPLALRVLEAIIRIKESHGGRLHVAKRHPILLILDDHLDIICWESLPFMKRHPASRIYSLHFAHFLYQAHKEYIKDGVREIDQGDVCYYIVNPDGNLPGMEERIPKFLQKRFPSWVGIIGKKPTEDEIVKALTESNSYVYCGHGSGSQYLRAERVQRLNIKPLQFLYGCSSVALRDLGGLTEMHGDVMEYALAKSGCTLGMLWPVTSSDTDKITMVLANICLPGTPVDTQTFEPVEKDAVKKEPELLRALREVRECAMQFFNGAALVARGIPIKLVQDTKEKHDRSALLQSEE